MTWPSETGRGEFEIDLNRTAPAGQHNLITETRYERA